MYRTNAWNILGEEETARMEAFAAAYRDFLDKGKTERE